MTIIKTQATYKDGVVIPKTKPAFGKPDKVFVTFVKFTKGNAEKVLSVLREYQGVLPKNFPSGKAYVSKVRQKMSAEWEKRFVR